MARTRNIVLLTAVAAIAASLMAASLAPAAMRSERLDRNLCLTTGGGKIVPIPGFPGERIDRRLLKDIKLLKRKYDIFITDGFSDDPVHASNGEHPMGLALDVVPTGQRWRKISRLARRAEPRQDRPIAPWRWVGYNGDAGHGKGHHLHLSWNHSDTRPGGISRSVYTLRCPGESDGGTGDRDGRRGDRDRDGRDRDGRDGDGGGGGGVRPGSGDGGGSGGIDVGRIAARMSAAMAAPVIETGGVDFDAR